jgi:hypothetical protein
VRLPVTVSKLTKSFAFAGKGAKKRAIVEGFAEEKFSQAAAKAARSRGRGSGSNAGASGKTLKFDKT